MLPAHCWYCPGWQVWHCAESISSLVSTGAVGAGGGGSEGSAVGEDELPHAAQSITRISPGAARDSMGRPTMAASMSRRPIMRRRDGGDAQRGLKVRVQIAGKACALGVY